MDTFLTATNILFLLFWVRLWSLPDRELYFNPFLSAPTRLTDRVLDFLRPVLPLPGRLSSLLVLAFLLAFRAVLLNHLLPGEPWEITVGSQFRFVPRDPQLAGALIFSGLHFLFFVARFWGVYVLVQLLTPVVQRDRASEAFHFAALPLSALRRWAQVPLLLVMHALLVYQLNIVGTLSTRAPLVVDAHRFVPPAADAAGHLPYLACLALFSVADLLMMAWQFMFALLVGSLIAVTLRNPLLNSVCTEGISMLLGRSGRRVIVGLIDLTPLLFMATLYIVHNVVVLSLLLSVIMKIA